MRTFTDIEILSRVAKFAPEKFNPTHLLVGIRSKADTPNEFDDKFFLYVNGKFVAMTTGTTNPGTPSLLGGWKKVNKLGSAIIKADEVYENVYKYGLHRQRMPALRQVRPMKYYRDGNNDNKVDESGVVYKEIAYTNFHFNSYNIFDRIKKQFINGWSEGCMVANESKGYNAIIDACKDAPAVSFALLKEW